MKDDVYITWERVYCAMCARDFAVAGEIVSKSPNEEIRFFGPLVPRRIVALWLELVQGNHPTRAEFRTAREQLYRNVEADRTDPFTLAALALADVALGRKEESLQEARRCDGNATNLRGRRRRPMHSGERRGRLRLGKPVGLCIRTT